MNLLGKRVDHNTAEVLLNILAKKNKDVFASVVQTHEELMPAVVFKDYGLIPAFLQDFCHYKNINPEDLKGRKITTEAMEHRKQFLAVLLLCFHPEKILNITQKRTWQGMELQAAFYLQCGEKSLANMIHQVVNWYHTYKSTREPVDAAHALIIERHQHQANDKVRVFSTFPKRTPQQLNIFG